MAERDDMLANIRANEQLARKLFDLEVQLLSVYSFQDLFAKLLAEIEAAFAIPHVWISVIGDTDIADMLRTMRLPERLKDHVRIVERVAFKEFVMDQRTPVLVNEDMAEFESLLPQTWVDDIASLAMAPLVMDERIVGSLNLADKDAGRFDPELDTFFLSQLSVKLSLCLSNVVVREKLLRMATYDPLTGLPNRRAMDDILEGEYSRADRYVTPLSVLFVDCDEFKAINDRFGHDQGDRYLKHVAQGLRECIRREDFAFRYAGDEFVVLLPNQDTPDARIVGDRIVNWMAKNPVRLEAYDSFNAITPEVSVGIASIDEDDVLDPASLLSKADDRLYEVKRKRHYARG